MKFEQKFNTNRFFVAENGGEDRGFTAFIIPPDSGPPLPSRIPVDLNDALTNSEYCGTFVFSAAVPEIADEPAAAEFLADIFKAVPNPSARYLVWLKDPANISEQTVSFAEIDSRGAVFQSALNARLTPSLSFRIQGGMQITLQNDAALHIEDASGNYKIEFSGPDKPEMKSVPKGDLQFSGPLRGCVQFTGFIKQASLNDDLRWGFQFLIPNPDSHDVFPYLSEWLPLVYPDFEPTEYIGFHIVIDPSDPYNDVFDPEQGKKCPIAEAYASRRTFFDFTGFDFDGNQVSLKSCFQTSFGVPVTLIPRTTPGYGARLVISPGEQVSLTEEKFHLCPEGDFIIDLPGITDSQNHYFCCGLSGTEFFKVTPQTDILRFISRKPAYIPDFPFPAASPVGPPTDPGASPFTSTFQTSWATLVSTSANKIFYVSQPKGASLFGKDNIIASDYPDLFGHTTTGFQLNANDTDFFPMVPYTGYTPEDNTMKTADVQNLEKNVISPQRRLVINRLGSTNEDVLSRAINDKEVKYAATPSGLIAKTSQNSDGSAVKWENVQLAWTPEYIMAFEEPPAPLINALQSSDVFLVAVNNQNIGDFKNDMGLEGWKMRANIGMNQKYGDYRNVMIFKGRKGKLFDPDNPSAGLVANPKKWTQTEDFSIPPTTGNGGDNIDDAQLVILSQWLQDYFAQAYQKKDNPYFSKFNMIAVNENWTGILFLRVDIAGMPDNLRGIIAGVTAPAAFNVHHLGFEISPVQKGTDGPVVTSPSSLFGLIYYIDPDYPDTVPVKSIAPTSSGVYDFRLLSLKVLFENTAVKGFESYAQVTMGELFGAAVTRTRDPGNIYRNVLLAGSLQINNGQAVYSLRNQVKDAFYFDHNIINKVEINDVLLSTISGDDATTVVSRFGMAGFIDFFRLEDPQSHVPFDIFSFGNDPGRDDLNKGLSFANLGIQMSFSKSDPGNKTFSFDTTGITFDPSVSTPRPNSLFLNLLLDIDAMVAGTQDQGPENLGYLSVLPDLRLGGVKGSEWYGLRFKLNMGTPGELAGKVNLNSYLLLSWSPDSTGPGAYQAGVGISLPGTGGGAKLISLQNVMKLSIGQIRLMYIQKQNSFLLLFTEIALKFLGLLKLPPGGNTLFYLFGNPQAGGKASGLGWYAMYSTESTKPDSGNNIKAI